MRGRGVLERLLAALLPERDRGPILGDLAEERRARVGEGASEVEARRWYRRQLLRSLLPALRARIRRRRHAGAGGARTWNGTTGEGDGMLVDRLRDVRFALRTLRRNPGFATAALLTLGLGIGAVTTVATVVDDILLRPLPFPDSERLVRLWQQRDGMQFWVSAPNYRDWREGAASFEALGAYSSDGMNVLGAAGPERLEGAEVTASFFPTLGVEPVVGRGFTEAEEAEGAPVVVISYGLWQRQYGGEGDVLGATLTLDGRPHEIVGVLPPEGALPTDAEFWTPIRWDIADWRQRRGIGWVLVVGRVVPDVEPETARTELQGVATTLREAYPDENRGMGIHMEGLAESMVGDVRTPLLVLLAGVLLVLVVACINVAELLLARGAARRREVAVRGALGGGRRRLLAQFLTESAVLSALGGALGALVAVGGVALFVALAPADTPRLGDVAVDGTALAVAAGVGLLTTLLFGLTPALHWVRDGSSPTAGLRSEAGAGGRDGGGRRVLVGAQFALAFVLAVGAGLLGKSYWGLTRVDPGFEAEGVLVVGLPAVESWFESTADRRAYLERIVAGVEGLAGVEEAGLTNAVPFRDAGPTFSYGLRGVSDDGDLLARYRVVTPRYFRTLEVPIVEGRTFSAEEAAGAGGPVVIVDQVFAREHFGEGRALGREVHLLDEWRRVVGVVGEVRDRSLAGDPDRHVFVSVGQGSRQSMRLVVQGRGDAAALLPEIRRVVRELNPRQPLADVGPLTDWVSGSVAQERFTLGLLSFFGGAALLLAGLGIYGLLSYSIARRTPEIGVRMALGASGAQVRTMVIREGVVLAVLGTAVGALLALGGARYLSSLLVGVPPDDPTVFAAVGVTLAGAALLAAWMSARRATRVSPSTALRSE